MIFSAASRNRDEIIKELFIEDGYGRKRKLECCYNENDGYYYNIVQSFRAGSLGRGSIWQEELLLTIKNSDVDKVIDFLQQNRRT